MARTSPGRLSGTAGVSLSLALDAHVTRAQGRLLHARHPHAATSNELQRVPRAASHVLHLLPTVAFICDTCMCTGLLHVHVSLIEPFCSFKARRCIEPLHVITCTPTTLGQGF